jgi:two-component system chemotaxis response regulator CheY
MSEDINEFETLTVLLVEDEKFIRDLLRRIIAEIGVKRLVEAKDGFEATNILNRDELDIDLIICDLEMPNMNGFKFVEFLRNEANARYSNLPVLILTGHTDPGSIKTAVELGINGFVAKPVSLTMLKSRMKAALEAPPFDPVKLRD